jgi:subtilisin family serine protease
MKKNFILSSFTLILCFCSSALWSQIVTKQVVVSFAVSPTPLADIANIRAYADGKGVSISTVDKLQCIPYTYLWSLTGTLDNVIATVDYISTRPNGGSSSQNGGTGTRSLELTPTQVVPVLPPCVSKDSVDAYSFCRNVNDQPVLMAVIDDGIGKTFSTGRGTVNATTFFQPYLWSNPASTAKGSIGYNFVNGSNDPTSDEAQHGSAVTFRIVDMLRKSGVSNVKIMILQSHDPVSGTGTVWNVCRALDFAYCNNANIINMSVGGLLGKITSPERPTPIEAAGASVFEAMFNYMRSTKSTLIVAAAGNEGQDVSVPRRDGQRYCTASYILPNLIEVAANANCSEKLATFSNFGRGNVHITAPGEFVYCAVPVTRLNPSGIALKSGTSLAAPHVSAAAAILATNRPPGEFNYATIVKSLQESATPIRGLQDVVASGGWLNTCKALTVFLRNYPVIRMAAPVNGSNTEGGTKTSVEALNVSPNPITSSFTISWANQQEAQTEVVIKDILGRTVLQQNWSVYSGKNELTIDASSFNKGIYFINMRINEQNIVQKVIKN